MNPNLEHAAIKAVETLIRYHIDPANIDPIAVLKKLPNVLLMPYATGMMIDYPVDNQDAITLVNRKGGKLQFIIIYSLDISPFQLRLALSRELAHVILEHDGSQPESVWSEEASCFAHHFLCPLQLMFPVKVRINYRPLRHNLSWEMKDCRVFDSIESMKEYVVSEHNKISRYIGRSDNFVPSDIQLNQFRTYDNRVGWKNCYDIVLDGKTVGYCGE